MKRLVLILALSLVGGGVGVGAGIALKPAPSPDVEQQDTAEGKSDDGQQSASSGGDAAMSEEQKNDEVAQALREVEQVQQDSIKQEVVDATKRDFVRLEKQFVVPVLVDDRVSSLVVLSIALEIDDGQSERVFAIEPKLRDAFLSVLFTHAQSNGFEGAFTRKDRMADLRRSLSVKARDLLGEIAHGVLLTNVVRQDI